MRGFPSQDTGPGMSELFHDLAVQQEEDRQTIHHGLRLDPEMRHVIYYGKPSWPSYSERTFPRASQ